MRAISQEALERVKESWEALVYEKPEQHLRLGNECFAVADLLRREPRVERALTETSRSADERAGFASDLLSGKVSDEVRELLMGMAREAWSDPSDFSEALEALGVDAEFVGARAQGRLSAVEGELYSSMRLLADNRDLRLALADKAREASARVELARKVWEGKLSAEALALVSRSVALAPLPTMASTLRHYVEVAASMASRLVAAVTVASPLTTAQQDRLQRILEAKYGREVSIHIAIDPKVVGGMRIHVGDDVIDGTLATRIKGVKDAIKK